MKSPALRYHGAKFRLAPWVLQHFPPHTCYVEPYGGAAGVLLQKPISFAEVYNDLDDQITNFFSVLRNPQQRDQLIAQITLTPYSRAEFNQAFLPTDCPIESARRTCIRAQMGFGSAGASKATTGFRIDTKRAYSTAQHCWVKLPSNLEAVANRFRGVLIENRPALQVMQDHDAASTLHFVDPPYVLSTRDATAAKRGYYRFEMTDADHIDMLTTLRQLKGMVVLSGYDSELYTSHLQGWHTVRIKARISGNRGTTHRTEVLYINPACKAALDPHTLGLF
jgi:DNA adenine methylase